MEISGLDFVLVKSRSIEGLSGISSENQVQYSAPVMASAPPDLNKPVKITLE